MAPSAQTADRLLRVRGDAGGPSEPGVHSVRSQPVRARRHRVHDEPVPAHARRPQRRLEDLALRLHLRLLLARNELGRLAEAILHRSFKLEPGCLNGTLTAITALDRVYFLLFVPISKNSFAM